jgi:dihydropteroate synthase
MAKLTYPFSWGSRTFIMGILNVTPDSFSGDGILQQANAVDFAVEQARQFVRAGADVIDIGGESTRPGSQPVSAGQELERIMPVLQAIVRADLDVLLSVDTYKASVAQAVLQVAPVWINDIWGLRADPDLAQLVARHRVPIILMHNHLKPASAELEAHLGGRYVGVHYENLLEDVRRELLESVHLARQAGVPAENIILDPGIGFGKTVEQNLELLNRLDEIHTLGFPVLLGPSRKSFIGYTLNQPPDQRVEGTAAAVAVGIVRGADIIRIHDVEAIARVARMTDAIVRKLV